MISFRKLDTSVECVLIIGMTSSYLLLYLSLEHPLLSLSVPMIVLILIDYSTKMNSLFENLLLDMLFLLE